MGTWETKVVGVTFANDDGIDRQDIIETLSGLDDLYLKDTASKEYPEAIAVFVKEKGQIGHLPAEMAREVRKYVSSNEIKNIDVFVTDVYDKYGTRKFRPFGCKIQIKHDRLPTEHPRYALPEVRARIEERERQEIERQDAEEAKEQRRKNFRAAVLLAIILIIVLIGFVSLIRDCTDFLLK